MVFYFIFNYFLFYAPTIDEIKNHYQRYFKSTNVHICIHTLSLTLMLCSHVIRIRISLMRIRNVHFNANCNAYQIESTSKRC